MPSRKMKGKGQKSKATPKPMGGGSNNDGGGRPSREQELSPLSLASTSQEQPARTWMGADNEGSFRCAHHWDSGDKLISCWL
jgi:hypothetical protein